MIQMMGGYGFGGMGYGGAGFLWPMIQIVILVVGIYLVVQYIKKPKEDHNSSGNAIKILDSRYAQGELADEEYERMKRTLTTKK